MLLSESIAPTKKKRWSLPLPFLLRRAHSLLGVWLVVFLTEHLWINAHMVLLPFDQGAHFVKLVNKIHALPFLPVIEITFLGIPFLLHLWWGLFYLRTGLSNARRGKGNTPSLPQYRRNRAYMWQRYTAWFLVVGLIAHVAEMRFLDYPTKFQEEGVSRYLLKLQKDPGLPALAAALQVSLYDTPPPSLPVAELSEGEVWGVAPHAGEAFVLLVRQTFQNSFVVLLYSLFVVAAVYHACNGLWTASLTWGLCVTTRAQSRMRLFTSFLMAGLLLLGLGATWGTYLIAVWL